MKRLARWLSAEHGIDEAAFKRMEPTAVEELLRDDAKAALSTSATATRPAAPLGGEERVNENAVQKTTATQKKPRGRTPKLADPQEDDIRQTYGVCRNVKATVERLGLKTLRRVTAHKRVQRIADAERKAKSRAKKRS